MGPSSVVASLIIKMGLDPSGVQRGAAQVDKTMAGTARKAEGIAGRLSKSNLGDALLGGIGLGAGATGVMLAGMAIAKTIDFMGDAITMASDLAETQAKLDQVYTESADAVRAWAESTDAALVSTQNELLASAATLGNFLQATGVAERTAAEYSMSLTDLAADLASFNNLQGGAAEAMVALTSGMAGETESARRLGIDLRVVRLEADLVAAGQKKVNGAFTAAQMAGARYNAIMKDTAKAQGDVARTSEGFANKSRTLSVRLAELQTGLGELILPGALAIVTFLTDLLGVVTDLADALPKVTAAAQDFVKPINDIAGRDVVNDFANLVRVIGTGGLALATDAPNKLGDAYAEMTGQVKKGTAALVMGGRGAAAAAAQVSGMSTAIDAAAAEDRAAFGRWRQDIVQGFGSVKAALANPPMMISRKDRIENLEGRTRKVMRNIAKSIKADDPISRNYWRNALVTVQGRLEAMRGTASVKSGKVASDFKTTWQSVRTGAITASAGASAAIASMSARATGWGIALGANYAAGIASQAGAAAAAAQELAAATAGPLAPGSPPKVGPLHTMDKWGDTYMKVWLGPMRSKGVRDAEKVGMSLGAALRPKVGRMTYPGDRAWERPSRAGVAALAGGGIRSRQEVHYHVGTLIATPAGLDELDRRTENRRRHRIRGAGRRNNDPN